MRRRIHLAVTVVGAATLALGAVAASSAAAAGSTSVLRCTVKLTVAPPAGSGAVTQPPIGGWQSGPVHCGTKGFGGGVEGSSFTVPDSGDTVGSYTQYFSDGTIRGKFDLVPALTSFGANFTLQQWVGKFTVTGGTGAFKAMHSVGKGVIKCSSPDTVHTRCTERVRLA